jgi:hypothetical protein
MANTRKRTDKLSKTICVSPKLPAAASEMLAAMDSPATATTMPNKNSPTMGTATALRLLRVGT